MTNFLALIEAVTPQQAVERLGFSEGEVMARRVVAESRIKLLKNYSYLSTINNQSNRYYKIV